MSTMRTVTLERAVRPDRSSFREQFHVVAYFEERGIPCIDTRRDALVDGGCIWVVDGPELRAVMEELDRLHGIRMKFTPNGGGATGYRPGWYL